MIRIALADDHAILRKGVAELLSGFDGIEVMMQAGNGKELISKLEVAATLPDICIHNIKMA